MFHVRALGVRGKGRGVQMSKALCAYRANEGVVSGNKAESTRRNLVDALLGKVLCRVLPAVTQNKQWVSTKGFHPCTS